MNIKLIISIILLVPFITDNGIDKIYAVEVEEWETIKSWEGSGIKNTEPFQISADVWRVVWVSEASGFSKESGGAGHIFQLYLQKPGDDLFMEILANVANEVKSSDTSYVYRQGRFYLQMNAGNGNWEVKVQIPK